MSYLSLLRNHSAALAYCFAFTFGSSVGQTFFVSLFMPSVAQATQTSHASLATLYSIATVSSALLLPWLGRIIDRVDIIRYGLFAGAGAMAASFALAAASHAWLVLVAMCLLRLFGLGLMSHVGWTGAGRYFELNRGKALSIVGLGHSAAEGLLPLLIVASIAMFGWRASYAGAGIIVAVLLVPLASLLVKSDAKFRYSTAHEAAAAATAVGERFALLRSRAFWAYLPLIMTSPLALTALLFFQGHIAAAKGWSLQVFAAGFIGFAIVQVPTSFLVGHWIDRRGAASPLVWHLLPLGAGSMLLAWSDEAFAAWIFLTLAGMTTAASSILRTAIVAELVPPDHLGEARSLLTGVLVLAAAAGPIVYGIPIAADIHVDAILWWTVALCAVASVPGAGYLLARRERPATA